MVLGIRRSANYYMKQEVHEVFLLRREGVFSVGIENLPETVVSYKG